MNPFLERFGFSGDPFQSTNASEEPKLSEYFVPPPYFPSVLGDPTQPRSQVVMAPRGGGKTAQRLMVENHSNDSFEYLCITYDQFITGKNFRVTDANIEYHLRNICELLTLSLLLHFNERPDDIEMLSSDQRRNFIKYLKVYCGQNSRYEFKDAIGKLKNFGEKVRDVWEKYGGKIQALVNVVISYFGVAPVDLAERAENPVNLDEGHRHNLEALVGIARSVGYNSVYILVDRIDEFDLTARDANAAYIFIAPLLKDLHVLEAEGVAFKFFLWDQIEGLYREDGARPDRIKIFSLEWEISEIERMLTERLKAFSSRRVANFNQFVDCSVGIDTHALLAYLANGSPRDLIRLSGKVIDEQTRIHTDSHHVEKKPFWDAVRKFCEERAKELFPRYLDDLKRIRRVNFTNRYLANDIFRVSEQAIRNKIKNWENAGAVIRVGDVPNQGNRPLYLYGVTDIRLAIIILPPAEIEEALGNYFLQCPSCHRICISDQQEISCSCGETFKLSGAKSLHDLCQANTRT